MIKRAVTIFNGVYSRLKKVSDVVGNIVSTVIFSLIYILILPWFSLFAKKPMRSKSTNWHAWSFTADSLSDLRKQY